MLRPQTAISEQIGNLFLRLLHPEEDLAGRRGGLPLAVLEVIEELFLLDCEFAEVASLHLGLADVEAMVLTPPLLDLLAAAVALVGPVVAVRVVLIVDHLLVAQHLWASFLLERALEVEKAEIGSVVPIIKE